MNYLKDLITLLPKNKGLMTIQDIAIKDGNLYLVCPFRMSGNVSSFMFRSRLPMLTETELVVSAKLICGAIRALHEAGRVHCAIMPSNIVVRGQHRFGAVHSELKGLEKSKSFEELKSSSIRA